MFCEIRLILQPKIYFFYQAIPVLGFFLSFNYYYYYYYFSGKRRMVLFKTWKRVYRVSGLPIFCEQYIEYRLYRKLILRNVYSKCKLYLSVCLLRQKEGYRCFELLCSVEMRIWQKTLLSVIFLDKANQHKIVLLQEVEKMWIIFYAMGCCVMLFKFLIVGWAGRDWQDNYII